MNVVTVADILLRQIAQWVVGTHSPAQIGASSKPSALLNLALSTMCCALIARPQLTSFACP